MSLDRLLRPRSLAVIGGGAWCAAVIRECRAIGFDGDIWPVHTTRPEMEGVATYPTIAALPGPPDAAFIGINRNATLSAVRALSRMGAGGAVCFASGFEEATAETGDGAGLQAELLEAAGGMRLLGPNCYGFINALDGVALWPDIHGMARTSRGVAIVAQSSNIALNLTMQQRGLPLAYLVTVGNQADCDLAEIASGLLEDDRVTALGLHIEGIADLAAFEALAARAHALGKPVVALKLGVSEQAQAATVSHTASLAGSYAGARALFERLGIGQVDNLSLLLESLKLLHLTGPLSSNRIASMSCSGGEACLMADSALAVDLSFPPLKPDQITRLRSVLGAHVALANPLDYHTFIWGDRPALTACFSAMMAPDIALGCVLLDMPRESCGPAPDWITVIDAVADTIAATGRPMAIISSLPETLPEAIAGAALARGILPLCGLPEAVQAIALAAKLGAHRPKPSLLIPDEGAPQFSLRSLTEGDAKAALAAHGLAVPRFRSGCPRDTLVAAARDIGFPVVLKGEGIAHKTEFGAVAAGLDDVACLQAAAARIDTPRFLIEKMVTNPVAELLIGVLRDPAHGFVLTLGSGGVLAEVLDDTASLLLPTTDKEIAATLRRLRIHAVLAGYRGRPAAALPPILNAVLAIQSYVIANAAQVQEVEVNPLICTTDAAIAVDALIQLRAQDT